MSPTLSLLLGLTVLIPQAFSAVLPVHQAAGINLVSGTDPQDPNHYKVPGTDIAITALPPLGPPLPSLPNAIACLAAAQSNISRTPHALIPRTGYRFAHRSVALAADPLFPRLGTYGQLAAGLEGLMHLLTTDPPGARAMRWLVQDEGQGTVLKGEVGVAALGGVGGGHGTATATYKAVGTKGWRFREFGDGGS